METSSYVRELKNKYLGGHELAPSLLDVEPCAHGLEPDRGSLTA